MSCLRRQHLLPRLDGIAFGIAGSDIFANLSGALLLGVPDTGHAIQIVLPAHGLDVVITHYYMITMIYNARYTQAKSEKQHKRNNLFTKD